MGEFVTLLLHIALFEKTTKSQLAECKKGEVEIRRRGGDELSESLLKYPPYLLLIPNIPLFLPSSILSLFDAGCVEAPGEFEEEKPWGLYADRDSFAEINAGEIEFLRIMCLIEHVKTFHGDCPGMAA